MSSLFGRFVFFFRNCQSWLWEHTNISGECVLHAWLPEIWQIFTCAWSRILVSHQNGVWLVKTLCDISFVDIQYVGRSLVACDIFETLSLFCLVGSWMTTRKQKVSSWIVWKLTSRKVGIFWQIIHGWRWPSVKKSWALGTNILGNQSFIYQLMTIILNFQYAMCLLQKYFVTHLQ